MAGGPYQIPRDLKGEGKILFVFSTKALIYVSVGALIGIIISLLIGMFTDTLIKYIGVVIFGGIGFILGTFKMPESTAFEVTRKTGGENLDDIIIRAIKFKVQKKKIYVYKEGGKTNE